MNKDTFYRVSVKGIAFDDQGRVLLAREDNGLWEMLGGGLSHREDPIECLKREIHEETGLVVTWVSENPKYFITAPNLDGTIYTANVIYEIKLKDLEFVPSAECQELKYMSVEDLKQAEVFPNIPELTKLLEAQL